MEVDTDSGGAAHGVDAEKAGGLELAGRKLEGKLAQSDGAVLVRVGGIEDAGRGHFAGDGMAGGVDGEVDGNDSGDGVAVSE